MKTLRDIKPGDRVAILHRSTAREKIDTGREYQPFRLDVVTKATDDRIETKDFRFSGVTGLPVNKATRGHLISADPKIISKLHAQSKAQTQAQESEREHEEETSKTHELATQIAADVGRLEKLGEEKLKTILRWLEK